eukprot:Awhi_evm1s3546
MSLAGSQIVRKFPVRQTVKTEHKILKFSFERRQLSVCSKSFKKKRRRYVDERISRTFFVFVTNLSLINRSDSRVNSRTKEARVSSSAYEIE